MRLDLGDRLGPLRADDDVAGLRIVGVLPDLVLEALLQARLCAFIEFGPASPVLLLRHDIQRGERLAVQPVGRPVRRDIAAMAPDRADLLAAHGLVDLTARLDVVSGENDFALRRDDGLGHRRCLAVEIAAQPSKDAERGNQYHGQDDAHLPYGAVLHGFLLPPLQSCGRPPSRGAVPESVLRRTAPGRLARDQIARPARSFRGVRPPRRDVRSMSPAGRRRLPLRFAPAGGSPAR